MSSLYYFAYLSLSADDLPLEWKQLTTTMTRAEALTTLNESLETNEPSAFQEEAREQWDHHSGK